MGDRDLRVPNMESRSQYFTSGRQAEEHSLDRILETQPEHWKSEMTYLQHPSNFWGAEFRTRNRSILLPSAYTSQKRIQQSKDAIKTLQERSFEFSVHRSRLQKCRPSVARSLNEITQCSIGSGQQCPYIPSSHLRERVLGAELQNDNVDNSSDIEIHDSIESSIVSTELSGRVVIDAVDEDALPVDHPRRMYDVVDFLHRWRSSSSWSQANPPQHPDVLELSEGRNSLIRIRRQELEHCVLDMQGIDWSSVGTNRQDALAARTMLHPSRLAAHTRELNYRSEQDLIDAQAERQYRFASFHSRKMHISHFQLRHLIGASNRSAIYSANSGEVIKSSLASPTSSGTVMKVSQPCTFRITCLDVSQDSEFPGYRTDKILMAGGFRGEYAMVDLAREHDAPTEGYVAPSENGLITHVHSLAHRRSGITQAVFCTNSHQVRTLDTRSSQWLSTFTYPNAVNCAVTSPDSRLRVLAGDNNEISIVDADQGTIQVTLSGHSADIFACAWSPDGRYVATGSEDTTVRIWDSRNWSRSLTCLPSVQTCPRSLHFTSDGVLIVAENEDIVSIHETCMFAPQQRQDLRFFGAIAGVAVLDGGAEIVVANADPSVGGLLAFQRTRMGFRQGSGGVVGGLMDDVVV